MKTLTDILCEAYPILKGDCRMVRDKKEWLRLQLRVKIEEMGGVSKYLKHENGRTGKDAAKKQKKAHGSDC